MKKVISISCSPSEQDIDLILKAIDKIKSDNPEATLFHAFTMDLEWARGKGYPVEIQEKLLKLFPEQEVFVNNNSPLRKSMAKAVARTEGKAFFIGEIKKGAAEEYQYFTQAGVTNTEIVLLAE